MIEEGMRERYGEREIRRERYGERERVNERINHIIKLKELCK